MDVKVGDRIRLLCDDDCDAYERGDIVMVSEVDDDGVYFNDNDDDRRYLVFEEFEPVAVADSNGNQHGNQPKFKVGDRVRCVDDTGTTLVAEGQVYTIEGIKDEFITVRGKNMFSHRFELVDAPLTIREGGYYRTRDGRKVGPMHKWYHSTVDHPWEDGDTGDLYRDDGTSDYNPKIIAEWTDEPVLDTSTTGFTVPLDAPEFGGAESKFKVGDRLTKDIWSNKPYEVTRVEGAIVYLADGSGHDWPYSIHDNELRLVAEETSGKEDESDAKLLVTISADTSALDAEIDRVKKRLKKLAKRARKLGIDLEYSDLRDAV